MTFTGCASLPPRERENQTVLSSPHCPSSGRTLMLREDMMSPACLEMAEDVPVNGNSLLCFTCVCGF